MKPDSLIPISNGAYRTPERKKPPIFPSLTSYLRLWPVIRDASRDARDGRWSEEIWLKHCTGSLKAIESVGCMVEATGLHHVEGLGRPCVFIGNHMSTLETLVLSAFLTPIAPTTFIVKEALITYPVFGHIMRACKPITVTRQNPRQDLKEVLEQGTEKLKNENTSIIVFPQTTRSFVFEREHFNTIGIKIAKRAGVPVIPLALKTDAWGIGWPFKDLGPIRPEKTIHFAFGEPMEIEGNGRNQHEKTIEFISSNLSRWQQEDHRP